MTLITRRLALFRIASTTAVTATTGVPVVALAAVQSTTSEDPALIRLGRKLSKLDEICQYRKRAKEAARAAYDALCPALPDELIATRYSKDIAGSERETDVEGKPVYPPGHLPQRRYHTANYLKDAFESWVQFNLEDLDEEERAIRNYIAKRVPIADQYEGKVKKALEHSDFPKASGAHFLACYAIERIIDRLAKISALTPEGISIKAEAYDAWLRSGCDRAEQFAAVIIGPGLAADVCRVLSERE